MLPKEDRSAMLLRLYNATGPIINHSKDALSKDKDLNGAEVTLVKADTDSDEDTKVPEAVEAGKDVDMQDADVEGKGGPVDTLPNHDAV